MNKGFTLIEILVVIAIIAVLATVVLPKLSASREKAEIAKAQAEIVQISKAIGRLSVDTQEWPAHQNVDCVNTNASNEIWDLSQSYVGLVQDDISSPFIGWNGPYMNSIPVDPWGNNYFLDTDYTVDPVTKVPCNGAGGCAVVAAVGSFGPDGVGQNAYNSDDIIKIISENTVCP